MKKVLYGLLLIIPVLTSSSVLSQISISIYGGYTRNKLVTEKMYLSYTDNKSCGGYLLSAEVNFTLIKKINLGGSVEYVQKNFTLDRTGPYRGLGISFHNAYLQIPMTIEYTILNNKKISLNIGLGAYTGYWLSGRLKGSTTNLFDTWVQPNNTGIIDYYFLPTVFNEKYQFDNEKDNRVECGAIGNVAINYKLSKRYSIRMKNAFTRSFSDQQKKYSINQQPRFNKGIYLQLGISYKLNHH